MSYCRIGDDSDVYVILSTNYEITPIGGKTTFVSETASEALSVLDTLSKLGYKVPAAAIDRLTKDAEND